MYLFSIGFLSSDEWTPNEGRTADIADKRAGIADKTRTSLIKEPESLIKPEHRW